MSESSTEAPAGGNGSALPLRSKLFLLMGVAALAAIAILAVGLIVNIVASDMAVPAVRAA